MRTPSPEEFIGRTVGRLTVVEYLGPDERRSGMWRCQCRCGGEAVRRTSDILRAIKKGMEMRCSACHGETTRAYLRERTRAIYVRLFGEQRTLYSDGWLAEESEELRFDIAWALRTEIPDEPGLELECPDADVSFRHNPDNAAGTRKQDWSTLYPIRGQWRYRCRECGRASEVGWCCVDCRLFVCHGCAVDERHLHGAGGGALAFDEILVRYFDVIRAPARVRRRDLNTGT